jgi:hypothetical protein
MKPQVLVLSTQCGDWEQLWVNGELIAEHHQLERIDGKPNYLWRMGKKYGFEPGDIKYTELDDADEEESIDGSMPTDITKYLT